MKKPRLLSLALVALLSLTLAGCGSPASLPDASAPPDLAASPAPDQTASQTQPETTVAPTPIPVEPDVFYYANALEFDRLYRQKKDGTGLTRVLDESVSNVIQQDGRVYFMDGRQALCYYDIPTAQRFELLPEVQSYGLRHSQHHRRRPSQSLCPGASPPYPLDRQGHDGRHRGVPPVQT